MPVKFKKGSKEAKAHMAKIRAMRGTSTHKDTKSHNVNIKVVSGAVGSLPFTGKFLGVNIKATKEPSGVRLDIGKTRMGINKNTNTDAAVSNFIDLLQKQYGYKLTELELTRVNKAAKPFIISLKKEAPSVKKSITPVKKKVQKVEREDYRDRTKDKSERQTGTSDKLRDKARQALPVGYRRTAWDTVYYENRANRSDKRGSLLGILGAYFDVSAITDLDTLKKEYKKLALKYHPDRGGTTAQMQSVNDEYDKLRDKILKGSKLTEDQKKNEIVIDEAIKEVINVLILIPDINIEVIGKWIWVSGNTYPVKSELSAAGLVFVKKEGKPFWIYKGIESKSKGGTPMDVIRAKYGVHKFDTKPPKSINGMPVKISSINRMKLKRSLKKLVNAINKRPI
jgi:hypothetical protein